MTDQVFNDGGPTCHPERKLYGRGLCCPCYKKMQRAGAFRSQGKRAFNEWLFWRNVVKTNGCWTWSGPLATGKMKYGRLGKAAAHRVSWTLANGPIPPGLFVCHRCDNPPCVNPAHLFLGTCKDNSDDKVSKGRQPRGPEHGNRMVDAGSGALRGSALSLREVYEIKRMLRSGSIPREVACRFNVTESAIRHIKKGRVHVNVF